MSESISLEERVARLEGRLGWRRVDYVLAKKEALASLAVLLVGAVVSLIGLGLPNHWYQPVLAILIVALCYHREWFIPAASRTLTTLLAFLNVLVISMMLKLVIGGGVRHPFFWALYPNLTPATEEVSAKWVDVVPNFALSWEQSSLALWSVDLTIIQTFLLVVTLFGALFEFQPFISFTAFLLILVSLPALAGFSWGWIFPAMILLAVALYLQSASYQEDF